MSLFEDFKFSKKDRSTRQKERGKNGEPLLKRPYWRVLSVNSSVELLVGGLWRYRVLTEERGSIAMVLSGVFDAGCG